MQLWATLDNYPIFILTNYTCVTHEILSLFQSLLIEIIFYFNFFLFLDSDEVTGIKKHYPEFRDYKIQGTSFHFLLLFLIERKEKS